MRWKKLGQIYRPESVHPKLVSHASNPMPVRLEGDVYRVFFGGRDLQNRSSVGFVDVDIAKREVVYIHDKPVFEHGPQNSFFSHGVSIGNFYEADGRRYIGFMGWQCPPGEHWRGDIGRLVLHPDFSMDLDGNGPFLASDPIDPVSLSYPWIMKDETGAFHMWYGSTVAWDAGNGEMLHLIKHAASQDGHRWQRDGVAVPYRLGVAQAFSHPCVIRTPGKWKMWYSYRGKTYRIGYAESEDGRNWIPLDHAVGIDVSASGWDSEMIEYPFVFDHKGELFMLYNGNSYGRTGFGIAVLESE